MSDRRDASAKRGGQHDTGLHRLTYVSSARYEMRPEDLEAILDVSRENNRRRHISGLLIYHDMQFLQTLEGTRTDLDEVFAAIRADHRHTGCLVLELGPVEARLFDGWAMAYRSAGELGGAQKQSFLELTEVRGHGGCGVNGDSDTGLLIGNFLSSFRDL